LYSLFLSLQKGYNGCIEELDVNGEQQQQQRVNRRKSKYVLERREKPNGVKPSTHHNCKSSLEINNCLSTNNANANTTPPIGISSLASATAQNHSVTYTLSRTHTVVVKYAQDEKTDMFQIGRSTESSIDFIVLENSNSNCSSSSSSNVVANQQQQSTISRYAARITVERDPPYTARIYAAGFDASKRIFLGVSG
jgi:pellino